MKCPQCLAAGFRSNVFLGAQSTTCMGGSAYYDADGRYHDHDPNIHTTNYSCTMGHAWFEARKKPCPTCDAPRRSPSETTAP